MKFNSEANNEVIQPNKANDNENNDEDDDDD